MVSQMVLTAKRLAAHIAWIRSLVGVRAHVYEQVVRFAELAVAVLAYVPFLGLPARRGHLLLDVPGQGHCLDVALHLGGRGGRGPAARERGPAGLMLPEPSPHGVHVQREMVEQPKPGGGEFERFFGGHHL